MSFATRVKNARKQARLTQKELADRVGVSQTAMHKLEVGGSLTSRKTVAIALTCGVDPIWLETGRGEMALPGYSPETGDGEKPVDRIPAVGRIPLLSWQEAENVCVQATETTKLDPEQIQSWVPVAVKNNDQAFALKVNDDSMVPDFAEGDTIIVDPRLKAGHNQYVVARELGEVATFKQLYLMGGRRYLKPLNQRYPLVEVEGELVVCGVVVGKYREFV